VPWLLTLPVSATGAAAGDGEASADAGGLATVSVLLLLHAAPASRTIPATAQSLCTNAPPGRRMFPRTNDLGTSPPSNRFPSDPEVAAPFTDQYPPVRERTHLEARRRRRRRPRQEGGDLRQGGPRDPYRAHR